MAVDLRMHARQAKTAWDKAWAAPERRRRHRWAMQRLGRGIGEGSAESLRLLVEDGFAPFVLEAAQQQTLHGSWESLKRSLPSQGAEKGQRTSGKAYFAELLTDQDLRDHATLLAVALDERVLTLVMQSMGLVPHLESIDILASTPSMAAPSASQLWHYDVNDSRIIKLFVYLEDCGPRNGPFTFIPAATSQRVRRAVGHYVDDATIESYVAREHWRAVEGAAGTAFLIDTGRCYHFGSRCELPRYAYVATYSSGLKFMRRSRLWHTMADGSNNLSDLQRHVCGLIG